MVRRIFNSFYLASTIVVLVNQSVEANQISAGGVEGISSTSQTIKLKVGSSGQKIRQVRASKIAPLLRFMRTSKPPGVERPCNSSSSRAASVSRSCSGQ